MYISLLLYIVNKYCYVISYDDGNLKIIFFSFN